MRLSGNLLNVLLALGLLLVGLPSAQAAETRRVGNTDGQSFSAGCPAGMAIIGFAYNSGEQLMAIVPYCQSIDADGRTSGIVPKLGKFKGVSEGGVGEPVTCKEGQAVQRLDVTMTEDSAVYSFRATCYGPGSAPQIIKATDVSGGAPGSKGVADCKAGNIATSVVGTYKDSGSNQGILSIGLGCTALGAVAAPPAAKQPDADEEAPAADAAGDDDNEGGGIHIQIGKGGISVNGKGGRGPFAGRTNTASMIYDSPGGNEKKGLKKGAKVSIIACDAEEEDWCEVAKPVHGWVWKPELDF